MYKCPYCRHDSKTQQCEYCHAMIPTEKTEKPKEETVTTRKRHKEMKTDGT